MSPVLTGLADYVAVLAASADETTRSENRPLYQMHLAMAARMFAATVLDPTGAELRQLVEDERRNYGWSFLAGADGDRAAEAFGVFAASLSQGL